jgi:glycosyltransferase involved in cell wall biosynthesis
MNPHLLPIVNRQSSIVNLNNLKSKIENLTVCIVTHNEEENIATAVGSVAGWAGEIVVVDCESTDRTMEIARELGVALYEHPNGIPEVSKNAAADLATREWVFLLDADEIIPEALWEEIAATIARNPSENGFRTPRRNFYFGVPLMHGGQYPNRQLRLFRRGRGRYPGVGIHEYVMVDGTVGELRNPFDHHPYPTYEVWIKKLDFYTRMGALALEERNVPITSRTIRRNMITRPLRRWFERLIVKKGIRDGVPGVLAAASDLITNIMSFGRYWMKVKDR